MNIGVIIQKILYMKKQNSIFKLGHWILNNFIETVFYVDYALHMCYFCHLCGSMGTTKKIIHKESGCYEVYCSYCDQSWLPYWEEKKYDKWRKKNKK